LAVQQRLGRTGDEAGAENIRELASRRIRRHETYTGVGLVRSCQNVCSAASSCRRCELAPRDAGLKVFVASAALSAIQVSLGATLGGGKRSEVILFMTDEARRHGGRAGDPAHGAARMSITGGADHPQRLK
jgi:hypothetical protein